MASRPSTMPSASMTCQARVMSSALGENVRTKRSSSCIPGQDERHGALPARVPTAGRPAIWAVPARWPAHNVRRCDRPPANGRCRAGVCGHSSYSTPTRHSPCGGAMTPAHPGPVAALQQPVHVRRPAAAPAHLDERPHDRADHLVAERGGLDVEPQQAAPGAELAAGHGDLGEAGVEDPPEDGRPRRGPRHPPAEGPEVVLPQQGVGAAGHGPQVEGTGHVPRQRGEQGVGVLVLEDQVAVAPGPGRPAGVEPRRGHLGRRTTTAGLSRVFTDRMSRTTSTPSRTSTWTTWPVACTPASVRPAHTSTTGWPTTVAMASARAPATVRWPGWSGETAEAGTVVGDRQPQSSRHHRNLAAPARSPGFGPGPPGPGRARSASSDRGTVDPTPAASGAALGVGVERAVKPARCAPWARCRPVVGRASRCGCSRRAGRRSAARSPRTACGPCPCP